MSRYQRIDVAGMSLVGMSLDELCAGLETLGLTSEVTHADPVHGLMLTDGLECAGEPVDVRLPAGCLGTVQDFGFTVAASGACTLVCGEHDRELLRQRLHRPLVAAVLAARARQFASAAGLELEETVERDGSVRLQVRAALPSPRKPR